VLFKDKTNKFLHQIRNIHLYEADYNFILKQKWREAQCQADHYQMIHSAQFGSTDPVLLEIMMQEISRMTNLPFVQINYDAQACYDRIIPDIAFQISLKYGVDHKIIHIVRSVSLDTKYFIKIGDVVT
jgi:hypothetical protein